MFTRLINRQLRPHGLRITRGRPSRGYRHSFDEWCLENGNWAHIGTRSSNDPRELRRVYRALAAEGCL